MNTRDGTDAMQWKTRFRKSFSPSEIAIPNGINNPVFL